MKAIGVIRKLDSLGRIVIPKELRKVFDIKESSPLEIFTEGDQIILKRYSPFCCICGDDKNNINFNGKVVCKKCIEKMKNEF